MKRNEIISYVAAMGLGAALTGCDVTKTEDGKLPEVDVAYSEGNMPKYEVVKTEDGKMPDVDVDVKSGKMPAYEVETATVSMGTKEVTVDVPDVDVDVSTEEKKVTVPDVNITMPDDE